MNNPLDLPRGIPSFSLQFLIRTCPPWTSCVLSENESNIVLEKLASTATPLRMSKALSDQFWEEGITTSVLLWFPKKASIHIDMFER